MPIFDGEEITIEISSDENPANYVDLSAFLVAPARLNRGRRTQDRASGSDGHLGRSRIKGQKSATFPFRSSSDAGGPWTVLATGGQVRAFRYTVSDTRMTGIGIFEDGEDTFDPSTGLQQYEVTFYEATGQPSWVTSKTG